MKRKVWFAMFAGLVGCPLVAGAQQGAAPVVCVGTPQFAAGRAAAQNPGQGRGQAPAPARGTAPPPPDITTAEIRASSSRIEMDEDPGSPLATTVLMGLLPIRMNILIAQEEASAAIKIDKNDKASVLIANTKGAGSFSIDQRGRLLAVQRMAAANALTRTRRMHRRPPRSSIGAATENRREYFYRWFDAARTPGRSHRRQQGWCVLHSKVVCTTPLQRQDQSRWRRSAPTESRSAGQQDPLCNERCGSWSGGRGPW